MIAFSIQWQLARPGNGGSVTIVLLTDELGTDEEFSFGPALVSRCTLNFAEDRPETFLLEMPVVGENGGEAQPLHGAHRNAIG